LLVFPQKSYMNSSSSFTSHTCYMPCLSHPPLLDHYNYLWWRVQVMKLLIMQFFLPHSISFLFGINIFLNTLFSNIFSLYSSLNIRDQVSHPFKATAKIIFRIINCIRISWCFPVPPNTRMERQIRKRPLLPLISINSPHNIQSPS
jgi:hypothetical protein